MSQARDQQAYQRGIWAAGRWSRLKDVIMRWDRFCVSKAREYRLPGWIGHVPIAIALIGSVAAILFGGLVVAGCMLFIWAIAFILQQVGQADSQENDTNYFDSNTDSEPLTEYRDGDQGYGLYCGSYRIDLDDD
ncbi:hypothetical protein DZB77_08250 [Salmonella enterica]|nr:hypothetical protein [Salmonella enterica]EBJ0300814.1 hypothetical protein [Salmonella enterica]EBM4187508.1 hypothetical protein [Salmonella enterica]EBT7096810.1 hypothetical protein [Salmonella enterica]EHS6129210.1 DUF3742 family protein [Salmonella enterica]